MARTVQERPDRRHHHRDRPFHARLPRAVVLLRWVWRSSSIGTGLLKPNVSGIVGSLYDTNDPRRDAGFSIFYMGINLGAALGPLVAGYLAQRVDWHVGFACAGVGMTLGLIQYILGRRHLQPAIDRLARQRRAEREDEAAPAARTASAALAGPTRGGFTALEWKRLAAMAVFFVFAAIFWGAYEQAGSTLNLFGDRYTRTTILGFNFPSSWFVSVQAVLVIVLAPVFAWLWTTLGKHENEPSTPAKFAIGLFFVGLSFVLLAGARVPASGVAGDSRQPVLARRLLLHSGARRAVDLTRRTLGFHQALAGEDRRLDARRVVPRRLGREQGRGVGRGLHLVGADAAALRRHRRRVPGGVGDRLPDHQAGARADGRGALSDLLIRPAA